MRELPAPRPAVNQHIDDNNSMVISHNTIYQNSFELVTQANTVENALIMLDPYGTAPLSAYAGIWSAEIGTIDLVIQDVAQTAEAVQHTWSLVAGANLVPVLGLLADTENKVTFLIDGSIVASYIIATQPLPATDSAEVQLGFPVIDVTQAVTDADKMASGLYFLTLFDRYNFALDQNGLVRWYVTQDLPSFNLMRLESGHFLATSESKNTYLNMYEFDMMGRVYTVYILDNQFHHSIWE